MMNQPAPQVNSITVNEIRISLIQFMPAMALLRSMKPALIPFSFLLSASKFQAKFADAMNGDGELRAPWRDSYGKLFWARYFPKESRTTDEAWRLLAPLDYDFEQKDVAPTLSDCDVQIRTYLYPWGIGLIVDFGCPGPKPLFDIVDHAFEIQHKAQGMMQAILKGVRTAVYADATNEKAGDLFSVVTVTDATGVLSDTAVEPTGDIRRALEALAGWNPTWRKNKLDPQITSSINIRQSPPGHILYGDDRGRVVWFPEEFRGTPPGRYPHTLSCYHQNLTIGSLHAESLCQMAQDASAQWQLKHSLTSFSGTYVECARLAAGILGRLHGRREGSVNRKKPDTYRSGSLRTQILVYKDDINTVRTNLLIPPSALDA